MNKKGLSTMIGYVLLVGIVITMSAVVYVWLKSYVPSQQDLDCPDGVSMFATNVRCISSGEEYIVNLTIVNDGRFSLGGYLVSGVAEGEEIATRDLVDEIPLINSENQIWLYPGVVYTPVKQNVLQPGDRKNSSLKITDKEIAALVITPLRWSDKGSLITCAKNRFREELNC